MHGMDTASTQAVDTAAPAGLQPTTRAKMARWPALRALVPHAGTRGCPGPAWAATAKEEHNAVEAREAEEMRGGIRATMRRALGLPSQ